MSDASFYHLAAEIFWKAVDSIMDKSVKIYFSIDLIFLVLKGCPSCNYLNCYHSYYIMHDCLMFSLSLKSENVGYLRGWLTKTAYHTANIVEYLFSPVTIRGTAAKENKKLVGMRPETWYILNHSKFNYDLLVLLIFYFFFFLLKVI